MIKRNSKILLVFLGVCFLGAFLVYLTNNSCTALLLYDWNVQFGITEILRRILIVGISFIAGLIIFKIIIKSFKRLNYPKFKIIYFAILPLFIFYKQFLMIPENIFDRGIAKSICEKTTLNGMQTSSIDLNYSEYMHIKDQLFLIPSIPITSKKINVKYYHDNFLGDFSLDIQIEVPFNENIDSLENPWSVTDIDSLNKVLVMNYFESES